MAFSLAVDSPGRRKPRRRGGTIVIAIGVATAALAVIGHSWTELASRVERARMLLAYREDRSFFAVGRPCACIIRPWSAARAKAVPRASSRRDSFSRSPGEQSLIILARCLNGELIAHLSRVRAPVKVGSEKEPR
jgi:hypothetical protein